MSEPAWSSCAAGHDARCEREYTASGFIFIDCLCSLRKAKAEAWDAGYAAACHDQSDDTNPHRSGGADEGES